MKLIKTLGGAILFSKKDLKLCVVNAGACVGTSQPVEEREPYQGRIQASPEEHFLQRTRQGNVKQGMCYLALVYYIRACIIEVHRSEEEVIFPSVQSSL